MITLENAVYEGYRSSAIGSSMALYNREAVATQRKLAREEKITHPVNTSARLQVEQKQALWSALYIGLNWKYKFFNGGNAGIGSGVKINLEHLWEDMGNSVNDLPDWDNYQSMNIKEAITFDQEMSEADRDIYEALYAPVADSFTNWEDHFIAVFDRLTHATWRAEGMRVWLNNNLDRTSDIAENIDQWDYISEEAGKFFVTSNKCMSQINLAMQLYTGPGTANLRALIDEVIDKYDYTQQTNLLARGGLYAINYNDLPAIWQGRVESIGVTYSS